MLCAPVTYTDVDKALASIDESFAPGIDGFNAVFFKKAWSVIKGEVYAAVFDFFENAYMLKQYNISAITFAPKVSNPTYAKDLRPLALSHRSSILGARSTD